MMKTNNIPPNPDQKRNNMLIDEFQTRGLTVIIEQNCLERKSIEWEGERQTQLLKRLGCPSKAV